MRTDESGEPIAHRVQTETEILREAQTGLDALLKKVEVSRAGKIRETNAASINLELEAITARKLRAAQLIADRFEWKPVACVILSEQQLCECGACHTMFRGFHTLFQRKADTGERLVAAACLDRSLPFQRREMLSRSPCCSECMDAFLGEVNEVPHPHRFIPCGRNVKDEV